MHIAKQPELVDED